MCKPEKTDWFDEDLMNGELGKLSTALIQGAAMCSSILYLSAGCDEALIKLFYCFLWNRESGIPFVQKHVNGPKWLLAFWGKCLGFSLVMQIARMRF